MDGIFRHLYLKTRENLNEAKQVIKLLSLYHSLNRSSVTG